MPNSPATSTARRGSIFRLQLASLLRPQDTARLMGGLSLPGSLLRSLGARPRSKSQGSVPTVRSSKSKLPEPQVKATENNLKICVSLDPTTALPTRAKAASTAEQPPSSSAQAGFAHPARLSAVLLNPGLSTIISGFVVLLVGVLDYLTGPHVSMAIVYLLPVIFTAWFAGKNNGILVAIMASLVWVSADVATFPPPPNFGIALWNVSSRLAVFAFIVVLLTRIRLLQLHLESTIVQRTRQLETETARCLAMEREVAAVSTREQQRIAHELHDGLGQELGGLAFHAKILAAKLAAGGVPHCSEAERLVSLLNQSISRTRALSNLLDPVGGESGGLVHALEQLAERSARAFGIVCTFSGVPKLPQLSGDAELNLYRIAQEAIHNATQHGNATAVRINLVLTPPALTLSVSDNGCGFNSLFTNNRRDRGMGLRIMRYRASGLGACLEIDSTPGGGCIVRCAVPMPNESP